MKRLGIAVSVLLVLTTTALVLMFAVASAPEAGMTTERGGGSTACGNIVCHNGQQCCFSCTGSPLCVKPGFECPVCL
ncbi:MAG TPA: hypothetical protein VE404_10700 [Verrucomicrobiae bacterium]|nr:hypothetical protein [Verrucomicrobiae bacterium]